MDGLGEAVVARYVPETCELPFIPNCQKKFLWAHKEVNLALHPVVDAVLQGLGGEQG